MNWDDGYLVLDQMALVLYFPPFLDKNGFERLGGFEGGRAVKEVLANAVGFRLTGMSAILWASVIGKGTASLTYLLRTYGCGIRRSC